jgi:peptidyl-prolyl cis-trans isomerase C
VARIGDRDIRYPLFERYLEENVGTETPLSGAVLSHLFDQFLDEELLLTRAVEEELVPDGAGHRRAVEALLEKHPGTQITDPEVADYYREHAEQFQRPERVRLRQILVEERARAQEAERALADGEDFAEVARRLSEEPSAPYGGDQGELSREDLPPRFVDVVFGLLEGEVSDIIPVEYGFHIFQVVERKPERTIPLAEAEAEIRDLLRQERSDRARGDLLTEVRQRYNVQVFERNLPFAYQGSYRDSTNPDPSDS